MPRILSDPGALPITPWQAPPLWEPDPTPPPSAPGGEAGEPAPADPLELARLQAATILEQAQRQAAQVLAEARIQGYNDGLAQAEAEVKEKVAALEALEAAVNARQDQFFARMQGEVVELAVAIASKVIGHEVEAHPDLVVEQVRGCLRQLQDRERIRVRVSPDDLETMRAAREQLLAAHDDIRRMDVVEDRRVSQGGCIVESENGTLDARLDRQLKEVERVMMEATRGGSDA